LQRSEDIEARIGEGRLGLVHSKLWNSTKTHILRLCMKPLTDSALLSHILGQRLCTEDEIAFPHSFHCSFDTSVHYSCMFTYHNEAREAAMTRHNNWIPLI